MIVVWWGWCVCVIGYFCLVCWNVGIKEWLLCNLEWNCWEIWVVCCVWYCDCDGLKFGVVILYCEICSVVGFLIGIGVCVGV